MSNLTQIPAHVPEGEPSAAKEHLLAVYDELRKLAAARLAHEKAGQTLSPTALVHEAYIRLVDTAEPQVWTNRGHFFAAAAEAMRRILVENARRKKRKRHGGECQRIELDPLEIPCSLPDEELLALDEALCRLEAEDPLKARLVQLRFFAGLTNDQAAELLDISPASAKRYWRYARAWLHRAIRPDEPPTE